MHALKLVIGCAWLVEERNLAATFSTVYPEYKSRTKMIIPFLL
jgi:protein-S-isoprenylcysteine O-methyltransferase Ste14